jgi:hypothetical protein
MIGLDHDHIIFLQPLQAGQGGKDLLLRTKLDLKMSKNTLLGLSFLLGALAAVFRLLVHILSGCHKE